MRANDEGVCVVLTTAPSEEVAAHMAREVLQAHAAACVNLLPGLRSHYWWDGALQEEAECLLLIKTTRAAYAALEAVLRKAHPYEVPEIVALDITRGWPPYLQWVAQSVTTKKE